MPRDGSGTSSNATGPEINAFGAGNSQLAHELVVRFEIYVVKVPLLLGVNGLQFRRISGNAWQYQQLARRVLQELKVSTEVLTIVTLLTYRSYENRELSCRKVLGTVSPCEKISPCLPS